MPQTAVLIAGAGPTGLVLALWLTAQGCSVRIIDPAPEAGTTSRALAVQARTLELYRQLDLDRAVLQQGHATTAVNLWVSGRRAARLGLGAIGEGMTPYPQLHIFPQDAHERLLIERLRAAGVEVERGLRLASLKQSASSVTAELTADDGSVAICEARFLVGCDGGHSRVRQAIGGAFAGGTYDHIFYVADVEAAGPVANGELHIALDEADFLAVFPLDEGPRVRLVGTLRADAGDDLKGLNFESVSRRAIEDMRLQPKMVNWFSAYRVHHRVSDRFAAGRVFLAGDAAHIHSPVGGQGMNTGIGDAINLAWKLAAVAAGRADLSLLDTYESERIAFARRLVATTDRAFSLVTAPGPLARFVRVRLAPAVLAVASRLAFVRRFMFRTVSQTGIAYSASALSQGVAGKVRAGDRLPWVKAGGVDNFLPLPSPAWQGHVYGAARPDVAAWFARKHLTLREFAWSSAHARAGLTRDALYLLRPDTYVGLADPAPSVEAIERYLENIRLQP